MTRYLLDVASYQGALTVADCVRAGFTVINLKISHGLTQRTVHPDIAGWVARSKAAGLTLSTFHYLTGDATGTAQARYAYERLAALGLLTGTMHVADVETNPVGPDATEQIVREYVITMQSLLERPVMVYTGDWWWQPKGWNVADLTPYLHAAPNAGYLGSYPGDASAHWTAGYGGWPVLSAMQYAVEPLDFPDGTTGKINVSKSALRDDAVISALTGGGGMATWVLVPAGIALRGEFNAIAPNRDKATDGSVGDLAHQESVSDHNPDETGNTGGVEDSDSINEVHAIDVDKTGPWPAGFSMEKAVQFLVAECKAGREKRFRYIIFNKRIWSASSGWVQKTYTGSNPHIEHAHFSFVYGSGSGHPEQDTSPYGLKGLITVATLDAQDKTWLKSAEFTGALVNAIMNYKIDPAGKINAGRTVATFWKDMQNFRDAFVHPLTDANVANRPGPGSGFATLIASAQGMTAAFAQVRAENAAQEAATAMLVQKLLDLVLAGGGDLDTAAVLAKLDEVKTEVTQAASEAGNAAQQAVMDHMRRAAAAQVAVLQPVAEGLDEAVRANPPQG